MSGNAQIPPDLNARLRTLAHDLSNSLETITQASYLLTHMQLEESARRWVDMIDQASREAIKLNRQIREVLRSLT
jgi:hypothetical protein